jgi:hypothetical protein
VAGDLTVNGLLSGEAERWNSFLHEGNVCANPARQLLPGTTPRVNGEQRLAPMVQVPGNDAQRMAIRRLGCTDLNLSNRLAST